jgi:hypothetical protein
MMTEDRREVQPVRPVTVEETEENKDHWLSLGLGKGHEADLKRADVLLVPERSARPGVAFYFHQDTAALFQYLQEGVDGQVVVELCASKDEYVEVALHSSILRIGKIVLTTAAVPVVMNLLSNYVYDELKAKPSDVVEASVVVEDHECKAFKFTFKGAAKDFHLLASDVAQLARECESRKLKSNGGRK